MTTNSVLWPQLQQDAGCVPISDRFQRPCAFNLPVTEMAANTSGVGAQVLVSSVTLRNERVARQPSGASKNAWMQ
jgi:hypothetical protein